MTIAAPWRPDDDDFWRHQGHPQTVHFPQLNFILLLAGGCVWMQWSVLTVLMFNAGFPFTIEQFFSLIASAGLAAACVRLVSTFILHHSGVRATLLLSQYLLFAPLLLLWAALADLQTPFWQFQALAISTGLGAGLLMHVLNTSYYIFSKKQQPLVQEVPLALANSGLVLVLVAFPLCVQRPELSWLNGEPLLLKFASSNISGLVAAGQPIWLNAVIWLPFLLLLSCLYWLHKMPVIFPDARIKGCQPSYLLRSLAVLMLALLSCALLLMPELMRESLGHLPAVRELSILIALALVLLFMRLLTAKETDIVKGYSNLLKHRQLYVLSLLYLIGMGSLLGLAVSYPLLIKAEFSIKLSESGALVSNPVGPSVLIYGWLPVMLGMVTRAGGNWLAYRYNPALINQWALLVMIISGLALAYFLQQSHGSRHPEQWFLEFFISSVVFFSAAGFSAGSTMAQIFSTINQRHMELALTWIVALATAGTFYIPQMFADHWQSSGPVSIVLGFVVFYLCGLGINWWVYLRPQRHSRP